ncbi:MAG: hypothetical protein ACD_61C00247G0006 [uncultured bacterium]|nr:MAG: hypothetical protein ACD_61C00247G0006 [uncultured bacterium]
MAEIIKETVTTEDDSAKTVIVTPGKNEATASQRREYYVYYLLGAVEILLAFRLVLKLMGASLSSGFVQMIYGLTGVFVLPFEGIFRKGFAQGIETTSVIEPATVVALIVYAVLAWGIVKLIRIFSGEEQTTD